ncbi:hypothetical protein FIM07_04020 [SAR202 cluster bacterium AD-802-F09_MRT_200m]|nr:hypothetical protein [SAR202 cluster bacterium AD-802-F09_MRT_200m]
MSETINELVNGVISTKKLDGAETFKNAEGSLLAASDILDYWSWAYSDIVGNTTRGALAEFIVARAIGSELAIRNDWAAYDLETPSGIKVEVKSSAYLQSWNQNTVSAPSFSIRKAKEWSPETNEFGEERLRHSDVYVFCLLAYKGDKRMLNPLDLSQWEFYVVKTSEIDRIFGERSSISINRVKDLSLAYSVDGLMDAVEAAYSA